MTALREAQPDDVEVDIEPGSGPWSRAEMLLAAQIDALMGLQYLYASAHAKNAPPRPQPLPRPGVVVVKVPELTDEQVNFLEQMRTGRR